MRVRRPERSEGGPRQRMPIATVPCPVRPYSSPVARFRSVSEQHWIEDLGYTVESFNSETGSRLEILARLHDLDAARPAYDACQTKYPKKLLYLSQRGRILRRSDHDG